MPEVPLYWRRMCEYTLHTKPGLAKEIWQAFCAIHPEQALSLAYMINVLDTVPANAVILQQRLSYLQGVLSPRTLFSASLRLAPEGKKRRRKDVVAFESNLLRYVDKDGAWL